MRETDVDEFVKFIIFDALENTDDEHDENHLWNVTQ